MVQKLEDCGRQGLAALIVAMAFCGAARAVLALAQIMPQPWADRFAALADLTAGAFAASLLCGLAFLATALIGRLLRCAAKAARGRDLPSASRPAAPPRRPT